MRLLYASFALIFPFVCSSICPSSAFAQGHLMPAGFSTAGKESCSASGHGFYKAKECVVTIDRDNIGNTATFTLQGGTTVYIQINNARWNEALQFTTVTTQTLDPDPLYIFFKNATTPLGSFVLKQNTTQGKQSIQRDIRTPGGQQDDIEKTLQDRQMATLQATAHLTCLEKYQQTKVSEAGKIDTCDQTKNLTHSQFIEAKDHLVTEINDDTNGAAKTPLPSARLLALDAKIKTMIDNCKTSADPAACAEPIDALNTKQDRLNSMLVDLKSQRSALLQAALILGTYPNTPTTAIFAITQPRSRNSVVTIAGLEVVSKTSNPISVVTLNWQGSPWVLSTGILGSNLVYKTYANTPLLDASGAPQLDSAGKGLTVVTENDQIPSIDTPIVFGHYRIPGIGTQNFSMLASGGVGANLTSKTADFAIGGSLKFKSVLFTPALVLGRETRLTGGVQVGDKLGSSPPATLPTHNFWVERFGVAITIPIPLQ